MKRVFSIIAVLIIGFGVWTVRQFTGFKHLPQVPTQVNNATNVATFEQWQHAVEKVKADRDESMRGGFAETPPELKHYDERYWFLATQIAEVARYNLPTCQDYFDLAGMLQRGEMVSVPGVTDTYVLYGVAQRVDDREFNSEQ
jgi:hypothetical protein